MRKYEFAEGVVHGEAVDGAAAHGDDELGAGAVHGEAAGYQLAACHEQFFLFALAALFQLEDAEDCAHAHTGIEVATAIDWIADYCVPRLGVFVKNQTFLFLFAHEQTALPRSPHGGHEEVVADDIKFLLVVAGGVGGAGEAGEVDEGGAADVVGYGFEGELEGVAEETGMMRGVSCGLWKER